MSAPMLSHTSNPNSSTQLQTNTPVATTEVAALKHCLKWKDRVKLTWLNAANIRPMDNI